MLRWLESDQLPLSFLGLRQTGASFTRKGAGGGLDEINTIQADAKAPSDDPQHITSQALFAQGGQYLRALHKQTHTHTQAGEDMRRIFKEPSSPRCLDKPVVIGKKESITESKRSSHDKHCSSARPRGRSRWTHYFLNSRLSGSGMFVFSAPSQVTFPSLFLTSAHHDQRGGGM